MLYIVIYRDIIRSGCDNTFLKQNKSHGKIYLSYVQGYRDENGKVKQKTVQKLGYLEELKKEYDDPKTYFKNLANEKNKEEITEITIKNLNTQKLKNF